MRLICALATFVVGSSSLVLGQQGNHYGVAPPAGSGPPPPTAEVAPLSASGGTGLDMSALGDFSLPGMDSRPPFNTGAASGATTPPPSTSNSTPVSPAAPARTPSSPAATNPYSTPARQQSQNNTADSADVTMAKELISKVMQPPGGTQLSGNGLRLADVVAGATSRDQQTRRIEMYWDLCASVADYYLSLRELDELNRLIARIGGSDRSLTEAVAEMRVRVDTSRRAAVASQLRLASAMGSSSRPLPADLPHVGGYQTRYAEIFGNRTGNEAAELNLLIPLRHSELMSAVEGVLRAQDFLTQVSQGAQTSPAQIVPAMELLALRRRAFVQLAKDYNRRIVHYTELSTPGVLATPQLVSMLIKSEVATASRTTVTPRNSYGPQSDSGSPPATFVGDWNAPSLADREAVRDESVTPASVNPMREGERSVIANPQEVSDAMRAFEP